MFLLRKLMMTIALIATCIFDINATNSGTPNYNIYNNCGMINNGTIMNNGTINIHQTINNHNYGYSENQPPHNNPAQTTIPHPVVLVPMNIAYALFMASDNSIFCQPLLCTPVLYPIYTTMKQTAVPSAKKSLQKSLNQSTPSINSTVDDNENSEQGIKNQKNDNGSDFEEDIISNDEEPQFIIKKTMTEKELLHKFSSWSWDSFNSYCDLEEQDYDQETINNAQKLLLESLLGTGYDSLNDL